MFAISFDMSVSALKGFYGTPKKSVRDIRGYRVENWSDFTELVKTLN